MNVKLLKPVPNLGRAGDIIEVSDAQARNYLMPKKLAVLATGAVVKAQAEQSAAHQRHDAKRQAELTALAEQLAAQPIHVNGKANPQGKLFAAVKAADIKAALERQYDLRLPDFFCVPDHLKTVGTHRVRVTIDHQHTADITIVIDHAA